MDEEQLYRGKSYVLLVEDNDDDLELFKRAAKVVDDSVEVLNVRDGKEAIPFLKRAVESTRLSPPKIVILDLQMATVSGFDVLAWIATRDDFAGIPVVVLSGADNPKDRERARALGAVDCLSKPQGHQQLIEVVRSIFDKWLKPRPN